MYVIYEFVLYLTLRILKNLFVFFTVLEISFYKGFDFVIAMVVCKVARCDIE